MPPLRDRIKDLSLKLLSDNWYILHNASFKFLRNDGKWQEQQREVYDRGNGATILLYNLEKGTIILTRQFRLPAYLNGHDDLLIETPAGLLDKASPEDRILAETEEETGFKINKITKIFEAYMSPGSVTEKIHFFIAPYEDKDKTSHGGGHIEEGEDIEVLEVLFNDAANMIKSGDIKDAKTILLIQYAGLNIFKAA